uniref:Uncharacterized protein n=1 Tax=Opuntia streptacantha TaxID=393608 RepID=A0A7C8ZLY1_OPUST
MATLSPSKSRRSALHKTSLSFAPSSSLKWAFLGSSGFLTVPLTVYPFSRRSFTIHEAINPPAPVTHTVCPVPVAVLSKGILVFFFGGGGGWCVCKCEFNFLLLWACLVQCGIEGRSGLVFRAFTS